MRQGGTRSRDNVAGGITGTGYRDYHRVFNRALNISTDGAFKIYFGNLFHYDTNRKLKTYWCHRV